MLIPEENVTSIFITMKFCTLVQEIEGKMQDIIDNQCLKSPNKLLSLYSKNLFLSPWSSSRPSVASHRIGIGIVVTVVVASSSSSISTSHDQLHTQSRSCRSLKNENKPLTNDHSPIEIF